MAENLLNFKFGQWADLPEQKAAGTVYVTTDEQAMYIDLPESKDPNAALKRLRIGDIIVKESAATAKPPFAEGAFYYFVADNALLRWDGSDWVQINSVSDVEADIKKVEDTINDVILPKFNEYLPLAGGKMSNNIDMDGSTVVNVAAPTNAGDAANKGYVDAEVAKRVLSSDFEAFKGTNSQAISEAKAAGTTAQNTITDVVMPKFDEKLDLAGGTMSGNITMGANKVTSTATPSDAADLTNKAYVDAEAAKKVNTSDFDSFKTTNNQAIADAKAAGTGAQDTINDVILPKFDEYLPLAGGDMGGNIKMGSHKITTSAAPSNGDDVTNKTYVDAEVAKKVNTSDFDSFKNTNTQAIADAKAAGTAAQTTITDVVMPKFAEYLALDGGTMDGDITMGAHKVTSTATPSAPADLTNKAYVDAGLGAKVNESDFATFKSANTQAIADAKAAGTTAQATITDVVMPKFDEKLDVAGGTLTGNLGMSNKAITDLAAPTNAGDAANKGYVDAEAAKKVNTSDFDSFKSANDQAIAEAKAAGTGAQDTINDVVMPKFNDYLLLAGGKMNGAIDMNSKGITNVANPENAGDAANKAYVDAGLGTKVNTSDFTAFKNANTQAIADAKAAGTAAQATITDVVLPKFDDKLDLTGGTMSGDINMNGSTVTGLATPENDTDAATKKYVDDALSANDAMTFKGVLGTQNGQIRALPATANVGDTYKVGVAGTYGSIVAKVGDLIINAAENDSDTPVWIHISSGYEDDYLQKLVAEENTIYLTNGIDETGVSATSGLTIVGDGKSNIQFAVTAGTGTNPVHTVTASMVWGTF